MIVRLARLADGKPRAVLLVAVAAAVLAGVFGAGVEKALDPYGFEDPQEERVRAVAQIERATGTNPEPQVIVLVRRGAVRSPEVRGDIRRIERIVRSDPAVAQVISDTDPANPGAISDDGQASYLLVYMRASDEGAQQDAGVRLQKALAPIDGVTLGGEAIGNAEVEATIAADLQRAELIAFPIILLLSLLFLRSFVAALLPPVVGVLTILGTFALLRLASEAVSLSVFALNLVTGLGLGLAIDYTLLITSRYREELARHGPGLQAMTTTLRTSGRTVLFSSLTVAGALASLLVFPQRFLYSMGVGGVIAPLLAAVISLTVLPAILALLGPRINALSLPVLRRAAERDARHDEHGRWFRLARFITRHPVPVALAATAVMLAAAGPALDARFTQFDARVLPASTDARAVYEQIKTDFPAGQPSPITVVVRSDDARSVQDFAGRVGTLPGVPQPPQAQRIAGGLWKLDVFSPLDPLSSAGQDLVRRLRVLPTPLDVLVGGEPAAQIDQKDSIAAHAPIAALILAGATLLVLLAMTGAIVLAVKQLLMNVLVVGAAFGISVLIFQGGRLQDLLGYQSQGALELAQPVLIVALVFALSTDYGVFLLSRIAEARAEGEPDDRAIAVGLERTGRIVTAAAVLFCVAIGSNVLSQVSYIKQLGLAVAFAVLIDAFVVRALLVPSLMALLGRWNWWRPRFLRRLPLPVRHEAALEPAPPAPSGD